MGKRAAEDELFGETMGSIKREIRTSMQREDKPTMETGLGRIAAKARSERKLRFTSLAHHITRERVWTNLCQIPKRSAPGVDGQTVTDAKATFGEWVEPMLRSVHRQGYLAPDIRRVYIPKPGKREKRPLGVPCVNDRALQRSTAQVLSAIYEADFLPCSFGGRPERGAHHALATLNEVIAALLHAEPEGQLQDWNEHREISLAAQSHVVAGPAATNPALVGPGTGQHSQRRAEGPLRLLRHCRKLSFPAKGPSVGRTLLAQNAVQPELGRAHHVGHIPPDQTAATDLATKAVPSLSGVTSSRSAVNHLLKSVVREICTLRSVGTGGGRPPPVTRWAPSNGCPYRNLQIRFRFRSGLALHLGSLALRRRGPDWNATKRR